MSLESSIFRQSQYTQPDTEDRFDPGIYPFMPAPYSTHLVLCSQSTAKCNPHLSTDISIRSKEHSSGVPLLVRPTCTHI